jgi:hypothetical protein
MLRKRLHALRVRNQRIKVFARQAEKAAQTASGGLYAAE